MATDISPQIIHIPAGLVIDQTMRDEHVEPGTANHYNQNVRITKTGGLNKRQGFTAMTSNRLYGGSRSAALRIAPYKDHLVVSDGAVLDAWSPTANGGLWVTRGRLPECSAKRRAVAGGMIDVAGDFDNVSANIGLYAAGYTTSLVDIVYCNGYYVIASWTLAGGSSFSSFAALVVHIVDAATGNVVRSDIFPNAGDAPRTLKIVAVGTQVIVAFGAIAAGPVGTIIAYTRGMTDITTAWSASTTVVSDMLPNFVFDMTGLTTRVAIAYAANAGGTSGVKVVTFNPTTLANISTVTVTTITNNLVKSVSCDGIESEVLWVAWGYAPLNGFAATADQTVHLIGLNPTSLATTVTATNLYTFGLAGTNSYNMCALTIARTAANEIYVAACVQDPVNPGGMTTPLPAGPTAWLQVAVMRVTNNSGTLTTDRVSNAVGMWPVSKPFAVGSRRYIEMASDDYVNVSDVVLVDCTGDNSPSFNFRPVGWAAPRLNKSGASYDSVDVATGTGAIIGNYNSRHVAAKSATACASVHVVATSGISASICITTYDFADPLRHQWQQFADSLYFTGGVLSRYDGLAIFEDGLQTPRMTAVKTSGAAGSATGTWSWCLVYEFTDSVGNVTYSAASPVVSVTLSSGTFGFTVTVRNAGITWREGKDAVGTYEPQYRRRIRLLLARTTGSGGQFYISRALTISAGIQDISFQDNMTDAVLVGQSQLYRSPGIVGTAKDRQPMGSVRCLCECNGVLVAVTDDGLSLRCTAQRIVGENPWHFDSLQLPVEGTGEILAITSMDGSVVAFKRDAIFVIPIDPASNNTSVGGFGVPRRIATDVGCNDPRSLVVTSLGIFFISDRGLELLNRSLSVDFVGLKIQDTFANFPNVTSAVLDVVNRLVRISLAATGSNTVGAFACYDLVAQGWCSIDIATSSVGASAQAVSACYAPLNGAYRYMWVDNNGQVLYEDLTTWLDLGNTWVTSQWETPWIKTELQREHQMYQAVFLSDYKTAHGLKMELAWDWQPYQGGADTRVWSEGTTLTYQKQVEARLTSRRQTFRARVSDTAPAVLGTGQSAVFVGLSTDLAPHQGPTQGTPKVAVGARA